MLPLKNNKKIRPSSAGGKLQTYPMYYRLVQDSKHARAATADTNFGSNYQKKDKTDSVTSDGEDLDDIRLTKSDTAVTSRRMTVDSVVKLTKVPLSTFEIRPKSKIESFLTITILKELGKKFQLAKSKPYLEIKLEDFKSVLQNLLGTTSSDHDIEELFKKIDFNASGIITLDQFCTYIHLCHADFFPKTAEFVLPARAENLPHRESVCKLSENFNGTLITCSEQGMFSFWSPTLKLRKKKKIVGESSDRRTPKWITDFLLMTKYNKLMIGTGNREIRFFEISSFDPYCQISHFESIPLRLEYSTTGEDECIIIFGDMEGQLNILTIKSVGECLRLWKKMPKHENFIASIPLKAALANPNVKFQRWSVHNDWVQQVKYCPDIKQVISCSNDPNTALVIGCTVSSVVVEHQLKLGKELRILSRVNAVMNTDGPKKRAEQDQTVFKVYKGVKCFDFNKKKNLLITGGMDRLIRIWNPYIPGKPTDLLHGHSSPICYVHYTEDDNWIFSMSSDKCVKVWHGTDFSCLYTLRPKSHRVHGELTAVYYSPISKTLAFTTNVMAALSLKTRFKPPQLFGIELILSHIDPVSNVEFNSEFKHIVTASEGSEVKVWDIVTGTFISQFNTAHGDFAISCMQFDNTQRRLITGGQDGKIRIWNYNTGLCLKELYRKQKGSSYDATEDCSVHETRVVLQVRNTAKNKAEVCDLIFVEMNRRSRFVVSAGWDRRINIYEDNFESTVHFVHHPTKHWDEDLKNGHREEILSLAQSPSHMLASASYDGEIIVWKMMSGHIFCHLQAPVPYGYKDYSIDGDLSIRKLLFLDYRSSKQCKAQLIASGPYANIHFWNIYNEGQLLAQFAACQKREANVTTMVLNPANTILYTADSMGFIYAWDINDFCSQGEETFPPPMIGKWRGHTHTINDIVLIDEYEILITASSDCTVRVWTTKGIYVGVFGQAEKWNIHRPKTFQHPMIPYDVLIDPHSLPDHPIMASTEDIEDKDTHIKSSLTETYDGHFIVKEQVCPIDEAMVAKLKAECFGVAEGIRLKHEKKKCEQATDIEQGIYKILSYHELNKIPDAKTPACLLRRKEDIFGTDFDYINE